MKKSIIVFIVATLFFTGCGSSVALVSPDSVPNHLRIEAGSVIWQKVYDGRLDQTALFRNLSGAGYFLDIIETEGYVTCHIRPTRLVYDPLGFRKGILPLYIANGEMTAFVSIQIKEDRYRITVERIAFDGIPVEFFAVKDHHPGLFKDSFQEEGPMAILNYNLGLIFDSINKPRLTDEF